MSNAKRTFDIDSPTSSKRARYEKKGKARPSETDIEFSHEDELEGKKARRGAVNFDVYDSEDEEVGGGVFSSDSEDEEDKKEAEKPVASEDFDMFGEPSTATSTTKEKPKLTEIEGQEFDSFDRVEEVDEDDVENGEKKESKISAFNMTQELEEGSLDSNGNYIRNKVDPQAFHDKWMEGISRKDMNKAKEALEKREREEALKEAERQSNIPQTQTDVYRSLVEYLKPGQTVQEALTSLANSLPKKVPAWKQKMLDKKNKNKQQPQKILTEQEESDRRQKVESITGLADQMMGLGHFNIYEDTFEIMVRHLRREGIVDQDWLPESAKQ
ncbi:hypothetical protein BD770DRAFT_407426 [Pilaira anomala]|nr:hypothetical protein BD770DRAFT_407426 [Pilaira anomala]